MGSVDDVDIVEFFLLTSLFFLTCFMSRVASLALRSFISGRRRAVCIGRSGLSFPNGVASNWCIGVISGTLGGFGAATLAGVCVFLVRVFKLRWSNFLFFGASFLSLTFTAKGLAVTMASWCIVSMFTPWLFDGPIWN